uniref:EGF-like calcium-binding domain-containing protein n=1 Tax=Oryza brachyantha TaxID=4533 RepID=J3LI67_ORYBR
MEGLFVVKDKWIHSTYRARADFDQTDYACRNVDWAIRNVASCDIAKRNRTDYACRTTNSDCVNSTNGVGYLCYCSKGYEGNPYHDGGCQDINECEQPDEYPCFGECTNTKGGVAERLERGKYCMTHASASAQHARRGSGETGAWKILYGRKII